MQLSIITPFYHGNQYLGQISECIAKSVDEARQKQPEFDFEWLIINDSPDVEVDVSLIAEGLREKTKVVVNGKNCGVHKARIRGFEMAQGEFLLFLDQDDSIKEGFIRRMAMALERSGADVAVCNSLSEKADGSYVKLYQSASDLAMITDLNVYLKMVNSIQSPGQCLIRRSSIPKSWVQYPMTHNGSDDLFLWILMLAEHRRFVATGKCYYVHRYTGENISESVKKLAPSSAEVVQCLARAGILSDAQLHALQRSIAFSCMNHKEKVLAIPKNPDLIYVRAKYAVRRRLSKKL